MKSEDEGGRRKNEKVSTRDYSHSEESQLGSTLKIIKSEEKKNTLPAFDFHSLHVQCLRRASFFPLLLYSLYV